MKEGCMINKSLSVLGLVISNLAEKAIKKNNCVFLRTITREKYDDEIKYYKKLQDVIDKNILIFLILFVSSFLINQIHNIINI